MTEMGKAHRSIGKPRERRKKGVLMAENKTKPTSQSVDAFLTAVEHPAGQEDARTR
jgi:hypothetical protein